MRCVWCGKMIGMTEHCSPIAGDRHCSAACVKEHEDQIKEDKKNK